MSQRQLGIVLLTGLGLYLLLQSVVYLVGLTWLFEGSVELKFFFARSLLPFAVVAGVGTLLLAFRSSLSERLFSAEPSVPTLNSAELVAALVAVLGVYVAVTGFENVIITEAQRFISSEAFLGESSGSLLDASRPDDLARDRLRGLPRVAIGVGLFLGANGIAQLWQYLRSSGPVR